METHGVKVFDVTLREGEQTPGLSFTPQEKAQITKQMIEAGLRYIEIGMIGVKEDEEAYYKIEKDHLVDQAEISMALLPCPELLDKALLFPIETINIVFPVSKYLSATFPLGTITDSFLKNNISWIKLIQSVQEKKKNIRLALADASRFLLLDSNGLRITRNQLTIEENTQKLIELINVFVDQGVKEFIFVDTVGLLTPSEVAICMNRLQTEIKNVEWGVHFHNDFGLATANTLTAYEYGATWLQSSFNFLGERCGIPATAEIVAALKYLYNEDLNIDLGKIRKIAYEIEEISGMIISERQPVIGRGLYWYETATPLLTMLKNGTQIFETIPAGDNGVERMVTIGKHTSKKLFKLYQDRGIVGKHEELRVLKQQAYEKRKEMLPIMQTFIMNYHSALQNSYNFLPMIYQEVNEKIDDSQKAKAATL